MCSSVCSLITATVGYPKCELLMMRLCLIHARVNKERAGGFADMVNMSADVASRKIQEVLEPLEHDPSFCIGYCCNGESVLSGKSGCACSSQSKRSCKFFLCTLQLESTEPGGMH